MTSDSSLAQEPLSRSLDAIRKSEAKLRQVLDTIPALVWSNLADGPNDFSNQRWQDYTGVSSEDARGWGWQAAVHPDDLPKLMETWQRWWRQGRRASSRRGFATTTGCSVGFSVGSIHSETSRERS